MLTVARLAEEMDLELAAGAEAAEVPIRWVHITELLDPTPWLAGGELMLTTGMQLRDEDAQRAFVRRLAEHQIAGLGFGTGFDHEELPAAIVDEARNLSFPIFEVPYRVPFIALTEKAFAQLVNEQYEVLQRGIATQKRLERLVLEDRGLDEVVRALAGAIGGAVLVLGAGGETVAEKAFRRTFPEEALEVIRTEIRDRRRAVTGLAGPNGNGAGPTGAPGAVAFAPDHPQVSGRALALPVATRGQGPPSAWLVAARDSGGLGDFERLILQQAVTVVALELMRQRVMRDTERRLAGDVLAEALTGRLDPEELETRLRPFGVGDRAGVLVFRLDDPVAAEAALDRMLAAAGVRGLVASRESLLCAVVDAAEIEPVALAAQARAGLAELYGEVRAAASRPAAAAALKRSFHEARCALEASGFSPGEAPEVATYEDLGASRLLLSLQDDEALRLYCDSVLGPLENAGGGRAGGLDGEDLVKSLEAFIEQNGQWEAAARQLFCHRHTLRYRIRRVEELTGRDLGRAQDRIEFWLALRARELVA